jgi:hypothetical protein
MEGEAVPNVKTTRKYRKNRKNIGMVGDDIGWCFQGPWYISIYGRWGCAKCKKEQKYQKKIKKA